MTFIISEGVFENGALSHFKRLGEVDAKNLEEAEKLARTMFPGNSALKVEPKNARPL
jgi:hypothetical protein